MGEQLEIGTNEAERQRYRHNGLGVVNDPHLRYDELRAAADVHPGTIPDLFGVDDLFAGVYGDVVQFSAIGFDACYAAFRDNERFSSRVYDGPTRLWKGANLVAMDEPGHHAYRALAQPAFAAKTMRDWERRWLMPTVDTLLDSFVGCRHVELYMSFCAKIPAHTICKAFGIPDNDIAMMHNMAVSISGQADPSGGAEASEQFASYLLSTIRERRANPEDDVVTYLVQSEIEGDDSYRRRLSDEEILGLCTLMLTAGTGTTYRTLGMGLLALLERPTLLAQIRDDRSLIPQVIEEMLRWEPPVQWTPRQAVRDTVLAGVNIPAGAVIDVAQGPANRDPRRWVDPNSFDPFRKKIPHLTFGSGPHFCIGNQLARMELRVVLNQLFDRFPSMRLNPEAERPYITGLFYRMPTAVPVLLAT